MLKYLVFSVIVLLSYNNANALIDLTFKTYEMCKETRDTPMKYFANFTKINSSVSVSDMKAIMPYDIDEDVTLIIVAEMLKDGTWTEVLNVSRKNPCPLINKYGGEVLFEMEKKFNVEPGVCPLPKGTYEMKNIIIDFDKFPISTLPKATIRSRTNIMRKDELIMCFYSEFESN